jgi:MFS family permease
MSNSNDKRLFWASFLTLIAAGVGFSVRGAILGDWGKQFGFTQSELGGITGFGFVGFGITIIAFSFVADRIGFGPLMVLAFLLHLSSAIVTLIASPVYDAVGKPGAYWCLSIGGLLFSLANGTCEAVINPLTATLFPKEKTHWLNILHAGWPGGLVLGAVIGLLLGNVNWEIKWGLFMLPTIAYGVLMLGRTFPTSEAAASGVSVGTMLLEFVSPILLLLLVLHAMVGYVELGTDSWIQNITGNILEKGEYGTWLFIWTSSLMFALRFFAGPIVHKISPLGLLFVSALLGCAGLLFLGHAYGALACVLAATVYGFGKTFFWPTMLGVVSERFPKGGAVTLGMVGGVGMISAGILGAPGIGYKQDYFATQYLQEHDLPAYERYKSDSVNHFLFFPPISGLDGSKVATLLGRPGENNGDGQLLEQDIANLKKSGRQLSDDKNLERLNAWWLAAKAFKSQDQAPVKEAGLYGGRMALNWTAAVPAMMAVGYLILILYFRTQGGYQQVHIGKEEEKKELAGTFEGGALGPSEA